MATPEELARQIRFGLSELGSLDGHHEFEHLCRHLARLRFVSNVMPATGPVAVGGDQGRDFETFRTYLAGSLRFATGFLALASQDTVVFACTLQKGGLKGKVNSDVDSICTQGTPVQQIYFFAAEPVPVATRHSLVERAQQQYQVSLEIIDGNAIAELLSDPDLFWIAETYLRLPAELRPPTPQSEPNAPEWYRTLKARWAQSNRKIDNPGEFMQAIRGLRYATDVRDVRTDLGAWIELLEQFLTTDPGPDLTQRARYEISRANLRGLGDLRPAEYHVRGYFADSMLIKDPHDLLDASVLLQYVQTACRCGESSLRRDEVQGWIGHLRDHIDGLLSEAALPGYRAGLLNAAAHLALHFDFDALEQPEPEPALPGEHRAPDDLPEEIQVPAWLPLVDLDRGMSCLAELVDLLPQAPTYPVDSLARSFDLLAPILIKHALYPKVRTGLDTATSQQAGDAAAADRCRKRAMALYNSGQRIAALRELHEAKINWWHGDTIRGSILAMLFIARIYDELLMPLAAKKYALCAAFAACNVPDDSVRDLAARGLFIAAGCDHEMGAWIAALQLTRTAVALHAQFVPEPWNLDEHDELSAAIVYAAATKAAVRHRPELAVIVDRLIGDAMLGDEVEESLAADSGFADWDEARWRTHSEKLHSGPPFADAAAVRTIEFGAIGQRWRVQCDNAPAAVAAAEGFCAAIQVLLVELVSIDPVFIDSTLEIDVVTLEAADVPNERAQQLPDNTCARWRIVLPQAASTSQELDHETLAVAVDILIGSSLLPPETFLAMMEEAFRTGLLNKINVAADYSHTLEYFRPESARVVDLTTQALGEPAEFPIHESLELAAPTAPGPGYDRERALEAIQLRYENCARVVRHTLQRALADDATNAYLRELVEVGRPEWIVLMSLANMVINYRVNLLRGTATGMPDERWRRRAIEEMQREEQEGDASPPLEEIVDMLDFHVATTATTVANFWGLHANRSTPDFEAIEHLLKVRYRYWDDDVEHVPIFTGR